MIEDGLFTSDWVHEPEDSPQNRFLRSWRPESALIGGRGTHKSGYLVACDALSACCIHASRGGIGYLTEQTNTLVEDVLLPLYKKFINPELYYVRGGEGHRDIIWRHTDCVTRLRSRQAKRKSDDPPFRGPSAERLIGHDEIAIDSDPISEDKDPILISIAMLRDGSANATDISRPIKYTTTPKKNWFFKYMDGLGIASNNTPVQRSDDGKSEAFYARTADIDAYLYQRLSEKYSADFARQELDAYWMDVQGLIWDTFRTDGLTDDSKMWPHSNIHWAQGYNPNLPTVLGVDLGATESAWLLMQAYPAEDEQGQPHKTVSGEIQQGPILVAIAEWTPTRVDGGDHAILQEVMRYTGGQCPNQIWIGHDYKTPGGPKSLTPEMMFVQHGWGDAVRTHAGMHTFAKDVQYQVARGAMLNSVGERRFCAARNMDSFHEANKGLMDMLGRDTWPSQGLEYFRKNKSEGTVNDEDIRDAMLYPLAGVYGAEFTTYRKLPA